MGDVTCEGPCNNCGGSCGATVEYPEGAPEWMVTFSDMVTLLLTFFVLMLAMATFDPIKYTSVSEAFSKSFGLLPSFDSPIRKKRQTQPLREKFNTEEERMRGIGYRLKKSFSKGTVDAKLTQEGLRLTVKKPIGSKEVQFSSAGAELSGTMKGILDEIAEQLKTEKGSQIIVAGHTDRHQVTGGKYEDNWDLSAARARAVRKYLKEQGLENVAIAAYANTKPLDPAQTSAADEKNRRIEIFIQRKYNKPETKIE